MKNKITLTIGIAAYNEENNIGNLISSLVKQNSKNFKLEKIIILSDGSTDKTDQIVKNLAKKNRKIFLINDYKRKGKPNRLNYLFKINKSDVVVCLDADIELSSKNVLDEIIMSFIKNSKISLVGGNDIPKQPRTFFESINDTWINYWQYTRRPLNHWNNPLNCPGRLYALRKNLAKQIKIPLNITVDEGFVFYKNKQLGYDFQFCPNAIVYFKAPDNFSDFLKQSHRFGKTGNQLARYFNIKNNRHNDISKYKELIFYIQYFFKSPIKFPLALLLQMIVKTYSTKAKEKYNKGLWTPIKSSK